MEAIANVMAANVEAISDQTQVLHAAQQADNSNKEPKAVIDKRDTTMLNLHKLLGKRVFIVFWIYNGLCNVK